MEKLVAALDKTNMLLSTTNLARTKAVDLLYSPAFADISMDDKVGFALRLQNHAFAEVFLNSPYDAQLLMIQKHQEHSG
jgi:hypothetical protein